MLNSKFTKIEFYHYSNNHNNSYLEIDIKITNDTLSILVPEYTTMDNFQLFVDDVFTDGFISDIKTKFELIEIIRINDLYIPTAESGTFIGNLANDAIKNAILDDFKFTSNS